MFLIYLRRELTKRVRQTILISSGLAVAIALVITVNGVSSGIRNAQSEALSALYGIGTDLTVTKSAVGVDGGPQSFLFGGTQGSTSGGTRSLSSNRLILGPGSGTLTAQELSKIKSTPGVTGAAGVLQLRNVSFSGDLPTFSKTINQFNTYRQSQGNPSSPQGPNTPGSQGSAQQSQNQSPAPQTTQSTTVQPGPPIGGFDGQGGSRFGIDSFSVAGVDTSNLSIGPLSSTKIQSGRPLRASDKGQDVAVVDATYANGAKLKIGGTLKIGGKSFKIVGIVAPSSANSETANNAYIPLDVAQNLSAHKTQVTTIFVQATNNSKISEVKTSLTKSLPSTTVNSSADLASSVSGSLANVSDLVDNLGGWLSLIVLIAAFLIAMLFTNSGINRRTKELGTLKALGWRNSRIIKQVMAESVVSGLIGGLFGICLGLVGIWAFNHFSPGLTASVSQFGSFSRGGSGNGPPDFGGGQFARRAQSGTTTSINLQATISSVTILLALGLALLGGLLAGFAGGFRVSRLSPAVAMRSAQ